MKGRKLATHHEHMSRLTIVSIEKFLFRQLLNGIMAYRFGICASQMKIKGPSDRDRRNGGGKPAPLQPYDAPIVRLRVKSPMADRVTDR